MPRSVPHKCPGPRRRRKGETRACTYARTLILPRSLNRFLGRVAIQKACHCRREFVRNIIVPPDPACARFDGPYCGIDRVRARPFRTASSSERQRALAENGLEVRGQSGLKDRPELRGHRLKGGSGCFGAGAADASQLGELLLDDALGVEPRASTGDLGEKALESIIHLRRS